MLYEQPVAKIVHFLILNRTAGLSNWKIMVLRELMYLMGSIYYVHLANCRKHMEFAPVHRGAFHLFLFLIHKSIFLKQMEFVPINRNSFHNFAPFASLRDIKMQQNE